MNVDLIEDKTYKLIVEFDSPEELIKEYINLRCNSENSKIAESIDEKTYFDSSLLDMRGNVYREMQDNVCHKKAERIENNIQAGWKLLSDNENYMYKIIDGELYILDIDNRNYPFIASNVKVVSKKDLNNG